MDRNPLMKTPAEKCAERICKEVGIDKVSDGLIAAIIQSEYAETFKVAREAIIKVEAELRAQHAARNAHLKGADPDSQFYGEDTYFWNLAEQLRFAKEQL